MDVPFQASCDAYPPLRDFSAMPGGGAASKPLERFFGSAPKAGTALHPSDARLVPRDQAAWTADGFVAPNLRHPRQPPLPAPASDDADQTPLARWDGMGDILDKDRIVVNKYLNFYSIVVSTGYSHAVILRCEPRLRRASKDDGRDVTGRRPSRRARARTSG